MARGGRDGGGRDTLVGGPAKDTFNVNRGADVVIAGRGNDYVLLYRDGSPDTVNCGPGKHDFVQYTALEAHDTFLRCERVVPYTP